MADKVLMLTNVHSPLDQRIYHKEAKTLATAGYRITIVGPGDRALQRYDEGIEVKVIPVPRTPLATSDQPVAIVRDCTEF